MQNKTFDALKNKTLIERQNVNILESPPA